MVWNIPLNLCNAGQKKVPRNFQGLSPKTWFQFYSKGVRLDGRKNKVLGVRSLPQPQTVAESRSCSSRCQAVASGVLARQALHRARRRPRPSCLCLTLVFYHPATARMVCSNRLGWNCLSELRVRIVHPNRLLETFVRIV